MVDHGTHWVVTTCSRWEQEKEIRSSLAEGTNILIDR